MPLLYPIGALLLGTTVCATVAHAASGPDSFDALSLYAIGAIQGILLSFLALRVLPGGLAAKSHSAEVTPKSEAPPADDGPLSPLPACTPRSLLKTVSEADSTLTVVESAAPAVEVGYTLEEYEQMRSGKQKQKRATPAKSKVASSSTSKVPTSARRSARTPKPVKHLDD